MFGLVFVVACACSLTMQVQKGNTNSTQTNSVETVSSVDSTNIKLKISD